MAHIRVNNGKKGKTYTVRVRRGTKEATKTFSRKTDATLWGKQKETEMEDGRAPTAESRKHTVAVLFMRFLKSLKRDHPERYDKAKEHLDWWLTHLGTKKLFEVEAVDICTAREELLDGKTYRGTLRSPSTANRYMSSLRQAFQFGVTRLGWLQFNVVKQISQLKEPAPPERFLHREDELPKLAEECAKSRNRRLLPLFMLAIGLGLRRSSLVGLLKDEVNIGEKTIRIPKSRMKKDNMITLAVSEQLMPFLIWLYEHRNRSTGLLFPGSKDPSKPMNFEGAWQNALERAGIKDFRFHDNRHTTGSYLTECGSTLAEVAALLGQKTLAMALRYSHVSDEHKAKKGVKMSKEFLTETSMTVSSYLKPIQPNT